MSDGKFTEIDAQLHLLDEAVRRMLAEDLPGQLATIQRALEAGDLASARDGVHAVRGSAAFCRLIALRDAAERLETSLTRNDRNAGHTRAFENNVERVLHALEHVHDKG